MLVSDFLIQAKDELQEKSEHWTKELLFIKLQDAYIDLQFDLPYFIKTEKLLIKSDVIEYELEKVLLKDISFCVNQIPLNYTDINSFFISNDSKNIYTYYERKLILKTVPVKDSETNIIYKYEKALENQNCYIEFPQNHKKALEYLFKAYVHEKPTRNTKDRNLNKHYINLYNMEINKLKKQQKAITKNITSNFQVI